MTEAVTGITPESESPSITAGKAGPATAFTFGDPTPVLESRGLLDYLGCYNNGRYYEPPVCLSGLSRTTRSNPFLHSGLVFKRNMLMSTFVPHPLLDRETFGQLALDYLIFGMGYLERQATPSGCTSKLLPQMAQYMRRGIEPGEFFQVRGYQVEHAFMPGSVYQLREPDTDQEIYGVPEWLPTMHSALLNESATLFRRKYYNNGSHAGFILYLTDAQAEGDDIEALRESLRQARGPGNFRNLFVHSPNGKKDGLQLIPVSEVAAKDEFTGIKRVTRDDILASLRVPPQLLGIVPQNAGGFGSIRDAAAVWAHMELAPLQSRLAMVNEWVGEQVVTFEPFTIAGVAQ
ncbi:phage portal protein [Stenotrophomonas indicatrix]|uniref:Phage portal protein n=1 Tax=Stenotrophomonas indicatrix TaxID=2045451 RepID=A0ABT8QEF3_9GAMM|nr:phage portal protein [Stenotrophomonas indicatrix]MDN8662392.1 phage portal protein [Stenotrophomonas indicatrix]MDN8670272.1 phage portal protein [Stenotrophomonas indicatrix]